MVAYCPSLKNVNIPENVTSIGDGAFQGCTGGLEGFDLSDKITTIGESAFADCGTIGYVTLPESITSIGTNAFNGSNIGKLFVGWDEPIQVETNTFSRVDTMYCPSGSVTNYRYERGWNVAKWYISTENPVGIEGIEANKRGCLVVNEETLQTTRQGVYAGGDAVTGAATVILAMGAGKQAAASIHQYLSEK